MKSQLLMRIAWIGVLAFGCGQIVGARTHLVTAARLPQSEKKEGTEKKETREKSQAPDTFSEEIAEQITQQIADGLEQHNSRRMLSVFDPDAMVGYANFQNQIEAMFEQYDSFRVHFRLTHITADGDTGIALADFQLEEIPRSQDAQPVRKTEQVRFEIKRGKNGWKIVEVKPRLYFS